MGAAAGMERAIERIGEVTTRGLDVTTLWHEVAEVIAPHVPSYSGPCCLTLDPATTLMTSHVNPALYYELPQEWLRAEYSDDDVHTYTSVARSKAGISTIHEAAGGDPTASPRWKANVSMGGDQELLLSTRGHDGAPWGCMGFYREPGAATFSNDERRFLLAVAPLIGEGVRRGLLIAEVQEADSPDRPGLVVLTDELEIDSVTPGTERWLAELPGGAYGGRLPAAVVGVANEALRSTRGPAQTRTVALARVMTTSGTWVVLHGATLAGAGRPRVAVIVEPAHPARITPLLMAAYGFTAREQEVTRLVLQGAPTAEIAAELVVSPHTVQQHLKKVFEKTGVHSRRELVSKVFFAHYEPRLRDNEQRVVAGRPLRGGPAD